MTDPSAYHFFASRSGQVDGEPDWMPGTEDVQRARLQLERRGAVRALLAGMEKNQPVPAPGQPPWLWRVAAVLWVVVWPALIAVKLSTDRPLWLSWWLPMVLAFIHISLLAAPVLFDRMRSGQVGLRRRFRMITTMAELLALEPEEFETWSATLFNLMGYEVANTRAVADHGIDLQVSSQNVPFGLVQCKRYRGTVGEPVVRDLYGTLVHEDADYAWLLTTGAISRQAREWCKGKPIALWDGQMLLGLIRRYR